MNVYFCGLHFRTTLYSLRTCFDTFNMFLVLSACTLITCASQYTHFANHVHSGYFQWFIAMLYEHPSPHLCVSVQCSRVYRKMCIVSILLETLKWISKVCKSFLTSSLNLDVLRGFVFPPSWGKSQFWHWLSLPVLILHESENLICLLAIWIFHLWSTFFISYVHFLFGFLKKLLYIFWLLIFDFYAASTFWKKNNNYVVSFVM